MYELHTQAAILVLSSGFHGDVLPSPFSKGGKKWLRSVPRALSEMELVIYPYMLYNLWTQSALLPVLQLLWALYPRVARLGTLPDLKARCWLWQSFTVVVRCCGQFLSLERSEVARLFQHYSKAAAFFKLVNTTLTGLCLRQLFS